VWTHNVKHQLFVDDKQLRVGAPASQHDAIFTGVLQLWYTCLEFNADNIELITSFGSRAALGRLSD